MKIQAQLTDHAVLAELGARLARTRLDRNLSQRELGDEAGLERKAVQRIEAGEPVRTTSLVRVLRALGMLEELDRLVPEPQPSPMALLELHGKQRERASGQRAAPAQRHDGARPWRWGDEPPLTGS
jgi:putative transcriptional regulator